jgi:hypothetical protein
MFEYKQRPWTRRITDEEYARAVGNAPKSKANCRCAEKGADGTNAHTGGLYRFKFLSFSGRTTKDIEACANHANNYRLAYGFIEVAG